MSVSTIVDSDYPSMVQGLDLNLRLMRTCKIYEHATHQTCSTACRLANSPPANSHPTPGAHQERDRAPHDVHTRTNSQAEASHTSHLRLQALRLCEVGSLGQVMVAGPLSSQPEELLYVYATYREGSPSALRVVGRKKESVETVGVQARSRWY